MRLKVTLLPVILMLALSLSTAAFARSQEPIPENMAEKMERQFEEFVFNSLKDWRDAKQDVNAFGFAIRKMAIYLDKGSVIETPSEVLLEELNVYCNTPENPVITQVKE